MWLTNPQVAMTADNAYTKKTMVWSIKAHKTVLSQVWITPNCPNDTLHTV